MIRYNSVLFWLLLLTTSLLVSCTNDTKSTIESISSKWVENNVNVPYKDVRVIIMSQDDVFATVEVHAMLRANSSADWDEHIALLELKKLGDEWQIDKSGELVSPVAKATEQAEAYISKREFPSLDDITMLSSTEGWAVGSILDYNSNKYDTVVVQYDNSEWKVVLAPPGINLQAIDMLSANEGWAVGITNTGEDSARGAIIRYDGVAWTLDKEVSSPLSAVDFLSPSDGWAAGSQGIILHYNGTDWEDVDVPVAESVYLNDLFMLSPTEVWVVGGKDDAGVIIHYSKGIWSQVDVPTSSTLYSIQMLSESEGWAVGDDSNIWHYINGSWEKVPSSGNPYAQLLDIHMLSPTTGWIVGYNLNDILYYEDGKWNLQREESFDDRLIGSIHMTSETEGWAGGFSGDFLQYHDGTWSSYSR